MLYYGSEFRSRNISLLRQSVPMVAEEVPDQFPVRNQREAKGHMVQCLDQLRCNASKFRLGLKACRGLGLTSGLALGFGSGFECGCVLNSGFCGDVVVMPCDGFFAFGESGCHNGDLTFKMAALTVL